MFIYHEKSAYITVSADMTVRAVLARLAPFERTLGYLPFEGDALTLGDCLKRRVPNRYFLRYGDIGELCLGFKMRLPSGEIWDLAPYPRAATGPDMRRFLTGDGEWDGLDLIECAFKVFPKPEEELVLAYLFLEKPDVPALIQWMCNHFIRPLAAWAGPLAELPLKGTSTLDKKQHASVFIFSLAATHPVIRAEHRVVNDYLTLRKGTALDLTQGDLTLIAKFLHAPHRLDTHLIRTLSSQLYAADTQKNLPWLESQWRRVLHRLPGATPITS